MKEFINLKGTYVENDLHRKWESVYRQNPIQDIFNDKIMDRILKYISPEPNALILDAGCGAAYHSVGMVKRGYQCVGVDISENVLKEGSEIILKHGFKSKMSFVCQDLEDLSFKDEVFDVVYCRGVLMHIPDWEKALYNLCRVLRPNGKIVIVESNCNSFEALMVLLVRKITKRKSKLIKSKEGLEFWSERNGAPFLVRTANIKYLINQLKNQQINDIKRFSTEFWDINRFPPGKVRNMVIRYNKLCFSLRLPPYFSSGNGIIGEKRNAN